MNEPISMVADVKPPVAAAIAAYLDSHKEWDCDRIVNRVITRVILSWPGCICRLFLGMCFRRRSGHESPRKAEP
jgi:hypothetical protein